MFCVSKVTMASSSSTIKLVVAGGINIDRTFQVNRLPVKGETIMGKDSFIGVGGKAANTAVACSNLGGDTSFIGAFGDDFYTEMLKNEMNKYKINTKTCYHLKDSGIGCGQAYIFLMPDGDNSIIVIPAANSNWPLKLNKLQIESIKNADCILLQREIPEIYNINIAKIAKKNNIKVVLDVGGEDSKISKELLQLIDIISPNETELQRLINYYQCDEKKQNKWNQISSKFSTMKKIKDACNILQKYNKNLSVLLKRGEKGAIFIDNNGNIINQSAMKLEKYKIKDTTGAGDCFTGAFTIEWIRQSKLIPDNQLQSIANAMKFACIAAGLSVQKKGTIASIPSLKDVVLTALSEAI